MHRSSSGGADQSLALDMPPPYNKNDHVTETEVTGFGDLTLEGGHPPHGGFFVSAATPMVRQDQWRAGWGDRKVCRALRLGSPTPLRPATPFGDGAGMTSDFEGASPWQ